MAGLGPAIHDLQTDLGAGLAEGKDVEPRAKPGDDGATRDGSPVNHPSPRARESLSKFQIPPSPRP